MMAHSGTTDNESSRTAANLQDRTATDQVVKEWLTDSSAQDAGKIASRIIHWPHGGRTDMPLIRHPWEGFDDVGFRTIVVLDHE